MSSTLGTFGESWAVGYLGRLGYRIVERNVRFRAGEIDIVAWAGPELVFVEVKCRRSSHFGTPQESITRARNGRLARATQTYLQRLSVQPDAYRIDVVAIEVGAAGIVEHHELLRGIEAPR